ncbi:MAG: penicillin-binding protein activator LpoB [Planctomycetes bacterium]|nr:penicillin-binding protein activator LpoB [Planctomycetota bacterium]
MDRRQFFLEGQLAFVSLVTLNGVGCRNKQVAHVLNETDRDMVGSHTAGAETWEPLILSAVGQLLGRQMRDIQTVSADGIPARKQICFVGLENKSAEELGDFGEQIYEKIDTCINESEMFELINRRYVEAGLRQCRLRPDDLFVPTHQRAFASAMEKADQPFDYLLFGKVTSGTTRSNQKDYQRDYTLTLELVNMSNGEADKESAEIRKGYHKSRIGKLKHYG